MRTPPLLRRDFLERIGVSDGTDDILRFKRSNPMILVERSADQDKRPQCRPFAILQMLDRRQRHAATRRHNRLRQIHHQAMLPQRRPNALQDILFAANRHNSLILTYQR